MDIIKTVTMHRDNNKGIRVRVPMDIVKLLDIEPNQVAVISADKRSKKIVIEFKED